MAALADAAALAVDPTFLARVTAAAQRVAVDTANSIAALTDPPTTAEKQRYAFCRLVLADSTTWGLSFSWALASLAIMDAVADDDTVMFQLSKLWDVYAGIALT